MAAIVHDRAGAESPDGDDLPAEVRAYRAEYRAKELGPHYRGWLHFAFTTGGSLLAITFFATRVHDASLAEWGIVPIAFFVANLAEYLGHKGPMHRPRRGLKILFVRHTQQHHHYFTHDAMAYTSSRDFKMVLFPPVMLFFFLGVIATPLSLVLRLVFTPNVGWLFAATGVAYFLTYEWLHFVYHLDESSKIGGHPLFRRLRALHQTHHDKRLMGKWNFNITFPICDFLFGTRYVPPASGCAAAASRTSHDAPRPAPKRTRARR